MEMKEKDYNQALAIITKSNSVKVSFNVPITDNYGNIHEFLIHECNATLVRDLVTEGFSCSMTPKGLSVWKF